jgi:hypothetical protein
MSAHWYWDWDWSSPPTTQPARTEEEARTKREERKTQKLQPYTKPPLGADRPDDLVHKKPAHYSGDPAPFPSPVVKPCQKVQVYFGPTAPVPNKDPYPHYPPVQMPQNFWQPFTQQEFYEDPKKPGTFLPIPGGPTWGYWIACERAADCCSKGCVIYYFYVALPIPQVQVNDPVSGNIMVDVYINDFKCRCIN